MQHIYQTQYETEEREDEFAKCKYRDLASPHHPLADPNTPSHAHSQGSTT